MINLTTKYLKDHFLFMFKRFVPSFKVKAGELFTFTLSFEVNGDGEADATWHSRSEFRTLNMNLLDKSPFHYLDLDEILHTVKNPSQVWGKARPDMTVSVRFEVDLGGSFHTNDYPKHIECRIMEVSTEDNLVDNDLDFELF